MLDKLSKKERFTLCFVNTRFTGLVFSFQRFKQELNEHYLQEIIQCLQISDESQNNEEFMGLFQQHPDVSSLDLKSCSTETLSYIGRFCPGLQHLKTELRTGSNADFKDGFDNLETLELAYFNLPSIIYKHINGLKNLKVLRLETRRGKEESIFPYKLSKMEKLETLEMMGLSHTYAKKILQCCSENLTKILAYQFEDPDLDYLLNNCPNLKTVGLRNCDLSHEGFRSLFRKLGDQLENLRLVDTEFKSQDFKELLNLPSTKLKAFDLIYNYENDLPRIELIKFLKKFGSQLERLNLNFGDNYEVYDDDYEERDSGKLDDEMLKVALEECSLLLEEGKWNLYDWADVSESGLSNFIEKVGTSLKVFMPSPAFYEQHLEDLANHCPNLHTFALGPGMRIRHFFHGSGSGSAEKVGSGSGSRSDLISN